MAEIIRQQDGLFTLELFSFMIKDYIETLVGAGALELTKRTDAGNWVHEQKAVPEDIEIFFREYQGGKFDCYCGHGWFVSKPCAQTLSDYFSTTDQGEFPEYSDLYIFARVAHRLGGNSLIGACFKPGRWHGWIWYSEDDPFCDPRDSCYFEFKSFSAWLRSLGSSSAVSKGEHIPCLRADAWFGSD